ncbi:hypothetical protein ACMGT0_13250 [Pseudomonas sp. RHF3.3-3]|uniref:hypothetical protein n=1 Tax=Pseudomonas sp. RHF3.3-3 TaxID=3396624 RepID=UPI003A889D1D
MFRVIKASAIFFLVGLLSGCITHSASLVSDPLQPASGEPVAYLVGSIGPQSFKLSPADNQRLLIRKRGSAYGAAGLWMRGGNQTPQDIEDGDGAASVFVLPLKPGDYEFYDFQFFSAQYTPGLGTTFTSRQAREKFNLPLRLEAGKAYYLGEFRSMCLMGDRCAFLWRDQLARDGAIALRQQPALPPLQRLNLDLKSAAPYLFIAPTSTTGKPAGATEVKP